MASSPLIAQGTLNRLRASVQVADYPELNVTAPFLGREAIRLALTGETTTFVPTMTGRVTSPQPYMGVTVSIHLLRTQGLAMAYRSQVETLSVIGDVTVTPDTSAHQPYNFLNCGIASIAEMNFSGEDAGYMVTLDGYYTINSALWDLD